MNWFWSHLKKISIALFFLARSEEHQLFISFFFHSSKCDLFFTTVNVISFFFHSGKISCMVLYVYTLLYITIRKYLVMLVFIFFLPHFKISESYLRRSRKHTWSFERKVSSISLSLIVNLYVTNMNSCFSFS